MTKHTEGPFTAVITMPGRCALIRAIDSIAGMNNMGDFLPDEFDANARLLAASATMFTLLVRVAEWNLKSESDDYINGDDGRTDGEDGWHDLSVIVREAEALLHYIEEGEKQ